MAQTLSEILIAAGVKTQSISDSKGTHTTLILDETPGYTKSVDATTLDTITQGQTTYAGLTALPIATTNWQVDFDKWHQAGYIN